MAQQTVISNTTQPLGIPNTGTGTDQGDTWDQAVTKLNAMFTDLYVSGLGAAAIPAGSGTATFGATGNIYKLPATVNSGNTNTSQTLATYTFPANTFTAAGQEVIVTAFGNVANNAAPKSIVLNIGAATINTATQTGAAYTWMLEGMYVNTSTGTSQNYILSGFGSGTSPLALKSGTDSVAITGTFNTTLVITDASAASNNVSLLGFTVEYFK